MANNTDAQIRHIFEEWHNTIVRGDFEALMALYADDAVLESPTVVAAMPGRADGVLRGRDQIGAFFSGIVGKMQKDFGRLFRDGTYFSNGSVLIFEYRRAAPNGDQLDLVESMDIENGLIAYHRVYWGWKGYQALIAATRNAP